MTTALSYLVRRTATAPTPHDAWSGACWSEADTLEVSQFHALSSDHRPITETRFLHDGATIYAMFRVKDRYVRCVHTSYQSMVSRDSCVEFFLQPPHSAGYFNFEINCGGTLLLYYIEDPTRTETSPFRKFTPVPKAVGSTVRIWHSLPRTVEPEIETEVEWTVGCAVPLDLFTAITGRSVVLARDPWRGNVFKCGDETSHPHWGSWAPIGEVKRFHQPDRFGTFHFQP